MIEQAGPAASHVGDTPGRPKRRARPESRVPMYGGRVREAKPGETCVSCGQPARAALVTLLGDVPTCEDPAGYADEIARRYALARGGVARSAGNSGAR